MRALAELEVLIVDCQTTGASPAFGHVLELGWGVARGDRAEPAGAEAHWIALPEGHRVPRQVQKITGYEPELAVNALAPTEAWQQMRAATRFDPAAPTAIHYARFELAFLRDWATRFEPGAAFPIDAVCVHAIASRLYPELPRLSLRALAGYLGHGVELARRSLGHVEGTAFVWHKLVSELNARGITSWEALQTWLGERAPPKPRTTKLKYPLPSERYKQLPDVPGVYRFLRSNGDVLYVGKATSLKKRVTSHFSVRAAKLLAPEMLTQVADIQTTSVASALEAALLEHDLIRALHPPYNVQLTTSDSRIWYASHDFERAAEAPDDHHRLGPLASEYALRPLGALIALSAGAEATPRLRGQAVGVSELWLPDEAVFAAGWQELLRRHPNDLLGDATSARPRALRLAKALLVAPAEAEAVKPEEKPEGWDPERVARHVEGAAATAYQAYRRARWLRLIHDCDIHYREPEANRTRLLRLRHGELSSAEDTTTVQRPLEPIRDGQPAVFDRTKYDRLRILTTELKRIVRDGGFVAVHWGPKRSIPSQLLPGILRVV